MDEHLDKVSDGLNVLHEYKGSKGHDALVEIAYQEMGMKLTQFMYDEEADLVQLRADFRAWMDIIASVDGRIANYEAQIKQVLEANERQALQQMGMSHGRF